MSILLDNTPHSLLLISFPHQLLHALSALRYYRMREGVPEQAPVIILVWAHQSSEHAADSSFRKILDYAIREFTFVTLVFPTLIERRSHLSPFRTLIHRIKWVRSRLSLFSIDAVFFAHDASADQTAQVLLQSFPDAAAICFGDPPGFLYPPFHLHYQGALFKRAFWKSRARGISSQRTPELSIVSVDFYDNRRSVKGNVLILPRELVLETLATLQSGVEKIKNNLEFCYGTRVENEGPLDILLLSNFTESGLVDGDRELELYGDICHNLCSPGGRLLIKPHFGTSSRFLRKLRNRLAPYQTEIFPSFEGQMPIEFFPDLVRRSNVISVSSSSVLLSHLFQSKISHALTAARIRKYFKVDRVAYMLEANQLIETSLSASVDGGRRVI
jgi:hypothetical protein